MEVKMKHFLQEWRFHIFQMKQNFNNKRMLKTSFIIQIISMLISNLSFFIIWMVFSQTIGTHNGWGTLQTFGMLSTSILVFGIVHSCFGSLMHWYEKIPYGAFDIYLTKPKSLYIRIINSEFTVSALGDLIQGSLGIGIFLILSHASFQSVCVFFLLIIPAVIIQVSFIMICNCIVFWLPQSQRLPLALINFILLPATQPISLLDGPMRFFYLFIVPALVIGGLPVETLLHADWRLFALAYAIALFWLLLSHQILKLSIRRYESGNSIGA